MLVKWSTTPLLECGCFARSLLALWTAGRNRALPAEGGPHQPVEGRVVDQVVQDSIQGSQGEGVVLDSGPTEVVVDLGGT